MRKYLVHFAVGQINDLLEADTFALTYPLIQNIMNPNLTINWKTRKDS